MLSARLPFLVSATSTTSNASSTTIGTGAGGQCQTAADCLPTHNECAVASCIDQTCSVTHVRAGTVVSNQTPGDCQQIVRDGNGVTVSIDDSTDLPQFPFDQCRRAACVGPSPFMPTYALLPDGTACGGPGDSCRTGNCIPAP